MSEHYLSTKSTHDRWNSDLAPQLEVEPGDVVKFDCFDSSGGKLNANSLPRERFEPGHQGLLAVVESDEDSLVAARRAANRMIDFLVNNWHLSPEHAYLLCGVAMDLRIHQVVNVPMVTMGASLPKTLLPLMKSPVIDD
jgi:acetamidase/formamidase